ncbi:TPA: LOW QUALITY PROTEIN: hypothetical protein N0F65_000284, partial [Lagenidium giganteum]
VELARPNRKKKVITNGSKRTPAVAGRGRAPHRTAPRPTPTPTPTRLALPHIHTRAAGAALPPDLGLCKMDKYEELKCIGRGSYGSAHLVRERATDDKYVVKKIPMELLTEKEKELAFREVDLLAKLKHPNVVEYKENFVADNVIHIVMAYCDGGDLAGRIRDKAQQVATDSTAYFDIRQILDWFVQMAMAIKYLHEQHILHRDLKTSNIFLTRENVVKLGDFGIAKSLDSTLDQAKTVVGTPYYMSPEVCESKPYSYASDVWSLGCVLYEMCTTKHAFDGPNILTLIIKIVQQEFAPLPPHYDQAVTDILTLLLKKNPDERPTVEQIFMMPYIRSHMQKFLVSGGSLLRAQPVPRPHNALKRRVFAKTTKRRGRGGHGLSKSQSRPEWAPIGFSDNEDCRPVEPSDIILMESSIVEEPHLAVQVPERSRTPEPLVLGPQEVLEETKLPDKPPSREPSDNGRGPIPSAWTASVVDYRKPSAAAQGEYEVEEPYDDVDGRFRAEAEELMNPNFQNEYSEECMDSRQIYYGSMASTDQRLTRNRRSSSDNRLVPSPPHGDEEQMLAHDATFREVATTWAIPAPTRALAAKVAAEEHQDFEDSSGALSESGILRQLEMEAESSDDGSEEDYTSVSEYDGEENFYSDDSDFYEENDTEYSQDFEDVDAEIIEYANDEFIAESVEALPAIAEQRIAAASPVARKAGRSTEVTWVMRNVAQSLLESCEEFTVHVA